MRCADANCGGRALGANRRIKYTVGKKTSRNGEWLWSCWKCVGPLPGQVRDDLGFPVGGVRLRVMLARVTVQGLGDAGLGMQLWLQATRLDQGPQEQLGLCAIAKYGPPPPPPPPTPAPQPAPARPEHQDSEEEVVIGPQDRFWDR